MSTIPATAAPAFMTTLSCRGLTAAWAEGDCTRRLYLAAARRMEDAHLYVISHALRFTAAQEKEHTAIFQGLLSRHGVCTAPPTGEIVLPDLAPGALLSRLSDAESLRAEQEFPRMARIAREEGYPRIADALRRIGETEALHARRFRQYADALADGSLFHSDRRVSWLCLGCGQLHTAFEPPQSCTSCRCDQGHFIRSSFHPFALEG